MKRFFLIYFLLPLLPRHSQRAKGLRCRYDQHDYYDDPEGTPPMHFGYYHCERCGKEFGI